MLGKFSFSFSRCSFSGDEGDGLSMEVFSTRTVELFAEKYTAFERTQQR